MKMNEFVALVAAMRSAQKLYFRSRSPEALENSKLIEKQVDAAVNELLSTVKQPSLFE